MYVVLASGCLDKHDSRSHANIESAKGSVEVKTSVENEKFKVELTGNAKLLLFEINEHLLFSRLVYIQDNKVCVTKPTPGREITIAGGEIKKAKCYSNQKEVTFIKACIDLEKKSATQSDGDKYKFGIYHVNEEPYTLSTKCGMLESDDTSIYTSWITSNHKLPKGYHFDASEIKADKIAYAIKNAHLCNSHDSLIFKKTEYTCTCNEDKPYDPAEDRVMAIFDNRPTCTGQTSYLLNLLAMQTQTSETEEQEQQPE